MKLRYLNKHNLLFFFLLFSCSIDVFAYNYTIINKTGRDLRVRLWWVFGELTKKPQSIEDGKHHTFRFRKGKIGLCLYDIMASKQDRGGWEWVNILVRDRLHPNDLSNFQGTCMDRVYTLRTLADISSRNYYDLTKKERRRAIKKPKKGYYLLFDENNPLKPGWKEIIYVDPYFD